VQDGARGASLSFRRIRPQPGDPIPTLRVCAQMGRMDDLRHQGPLERGSVRKYATKTGFSRIHVNRPFPVVTGYQMTL
jgi:hypothetical protein